MKNIYTLNFEELSQFILSMGCAKFRAKQIWDWLYCKQVTNFSDMKNIDSKTLTLLEGNFFISELEEVSHLVDVDQTQKSLLKLNDGELIETVLMRQRHGNSVCVTTQVGCKIGCSFCASHIGGFTRNLDSGEIVQQVLYWESKLSEIGQSVTHIVVMGIGEPFDNYDNVLGFIDVINDPLGLKIGARHITVSTSGIVPRIYDFAQYPKQVNLAISLHAPTDEIRSSIMQINKKYPINEVIEAAKKYVRVTNRRVSFEYIMISGVNDSSVCALLLVKLLRGINCHVNLIPFNDVSELSLTKSSQIMTKEFSDILEQHKIQVSIRTPKGENIDGACGQLRLKNV